MCGRFFQLNSLTDLLNQVIENLVTKTEVSDHFNQCPGNSCPVVMNYKDQNILLNVKWGFQVPGMDNSIINAKSETITEKPLFKEPFEKARCLIPVNGFYEWHDKHPYVIEPEDKSGQFLAGIWRVEGGVPVFCVLTQEAPSPLSELHHRVPVIIPANKCKNWLNKDNDSFFDPSLFNSWHSYQVGKLVNSPQHNTPDCLIPASL